MQSEQKQNFNKTCVFRALRYLAPHDILKYIWKLLQLFYNLLTVNAFLFFGLAARIKAPVLEFPQFWPHR